MPPSPSLSASGVTTAIQLRNTFCKRWGAINRARMIDRRRKSNQKEMQLHAFKNRQIFSAYYSLIRKWQAFDLAHLFVKLEMLFALLIPFYAIGICKEPDSVSSIVNIFSFNDYHSDSGYCQSPCPDNIQTKNDTLFGYLWNDGIDERYHVKYDFGNSICELQFSLNIKFKVKKYSCSWYKVTGKVGRQISDKYFEYKVDHLYPFKLENSHIDSVAQKIGAWIDKNRVFVNLNELKKYYPQTNQFSQLLATDFNKRPFEKCATIAFTDSKNRFYFFICGNTLLLQGPQLIHGLRYWAIWDDRKGAIDRVNIVKTSKFLE